MARHPKKPSATERNRRTQERLRKKEIEATPASSGGGSVSPVRFRAENNVGLTISTNTLTPMLFETVVLDDAGTYVTEDPDPGWTRSFYPATTAGWYWIHVSLDWSFSNDGEWGHIRLIDASDNSTISRRFRRPMNTLAAGMDALGSDMEFGEMLYSDGTAQFSVEVSAGLGTSTAAHRDISGIFEGFLIR